jgi:hypothetical protein
MSTTFFGQGTSDPVDELDELDVSSNPLLESPVSVDVVGPPEDDDVLPRVDVGCPEVDEASASVLAVSEVDPVSSAATGSDPPHAAIGTRVRRMPRTSGV